MKVSTCIALFFAGMVCGCMIMIFVTSNDSSAAAANRANVQHAVDACIAQGGTPTFGWVRNEGELATVNGCVK